MKSSVFLKGVSKSATQFFNKLTRIYGEVFTLQIARYTIHFLLSPLHIKHVLSDHVENYGKLTHHLGIVHDIVSEHGLLTTSNHALWKKDREAVNPLFLEKNIKNFTDAMVNTTEKCLDAWQDSAIHGKPIYISKDMTLLALKNMVQLFMGDVAINTDQVNSILNHVMDLATKYKMYRGKIAGIIPTPAYFKCKKAIQEARALGEHLVDLCLKTDTDNVVKAIANAYENNNETISKKHLIGEALTFLIAGHETTGGSLSWACLYMSLYPAIQQKMHEEVINAIGYRKPTAADLESFPYIQAVFYEVLRIQPPFPNLARFAIKDDTIGTLKIHKGDSIIILSHQAHRLPRYWPNPEGFDPTRFLKPLDEEYKYLYLPFGAGPRSCVGQHFALIESIIALVMIVQRYKLYSIPGTSLKEEKSLVNRPSFDLLLTAHLYD